MLIQRRALSHDQWWASSLAAQHRLLLLDEYRHAECIALYAAAMNEVDTQLLLTDALSCGKRVLFPVVCGEQMLLRGVADRDDFHVGAFGIPEPCSGGAEHLADEPDLIVVPGIAFDLAGHRLGYGKGYYDRFLHHPGRTAHLLGLCHDFQLRSTLLPADHHDIPMELLVTDQRTVRIDRPQSGSDRGAPGAPD